MADFGLTRRLTAEALGTAFLLATVVGSGIMAEGLAGGNMAIALLGNTIATGAILVVLILIFGPVSGAHLNPAVTFSFLIQKKISKNLALFYLVVQIVGAVLGVLAAHLMFDQPAIFPSLKPRTGVPQWAGEFIATFGLIVTILGCVRFKPDAVPYAVGLYITAGYWFTSSTSFANPAVTIARSLSNTFSGISPDHVPAFILAQFLGALTATILMVWLLKPATGGH